MIDPTAGRPNDGTAFTQSRNISLGDTAYNAVEADEEEDLEDILAELYDDEEEGGNRMEIQMNQVHKNMGQHRPNTLTSSSREDGGSSRESTEKTSSKESLSSGNGSRGDRPAQKALASDLAKSTLQADEAVPVQDLSRQFRQPLVAVSANADKCYDRINHIIMSLLLLAIGGR